MTDEQQPTAVQELRSDPSSRKRFLRNIGGGAAAAGFAAFLAACGDDESSGGASGSGGASTTSKMASGGGDLAIVNYALTLEYLEADFYRQVVDSGMVKDRRIAALATQFGDQEQEHVDALLATAKKLGKPAQAPKTDFQAVLDGGPTKILETAAAVENLGASAYLGQAGRIKDKEILAAALAIHSVEARHAAALNAIAGKGLKGAIPDGAFAKPMAMDAVLEQVKPFLAA